MGGVCFILKGWRDTKQRELGIRWGRARTLRFPVAPRKYCGFLRYVRERKLVAAWPHCPLKRQADRHFRKYVSAGNTLARANFPAKSCHVSHICTYIYARTRVWIRRNRERKVARTIRINCNGFVDVNSGRLDVWRIK